MNNLKKVILTRYIETDQGTEGILVAPGFTCFTLELPWRDNQPNISCIQPGEYKCVPFSGYRFKNVYHVTNVPNRSYILIHTGNVAGDKNKGYKTHVYGCILLGMKKGYLWNQRAVLLSRVALRRFKQSMNYEPFILKIISLVR